MSIVTLSSMISRSAQLLIAALPQNSRRASLTSASSAKVADSAVPSEAFVAAMYAATTDGSLVVISERVMVFPVVRSVIQSPYDRGVSDFVSSESAGLVAIHRLAPRPQQDAAASGIAFPRLAGGCDTVGAEVAVALPQLAPGDQHARLVHEAEGEGPDNALAPRAIGAFVVDPQLRLRADRRPQRRQRHRIRRKAASRRSRQDGRIAQGLLRRGREHRGD